MLMVKPGLPYLDVIYRLRQASNLPIAAYHVSGEYSMLKAAVERGWLDERKVALETLTCCRPRQQWPTAVAQRCTGRKRARWLGDARGRAVCRP